MEKVRYPKNRIGLEIERGIRNEATVPPDIAAKYIRNVKRAEKQRSNRHIVANKADAKAEERVAKLKRSGSGN